MTPLTYVSIDIEADGPCPGMHSMLGFGAAAFAEDKTLLGTYEANLVTLPDATPDPDTTAWWQTQPEAWAYLQQNKRLASEVMPEFKAWVEALPQPVAFLGYPSCFDFPWMNYYFKYFADGNPFGYEGIDVKSYAAAVLNWQWDLVSMSTMPRHWFDKPNDMPHRALSDAIEQGLLFCNILREQNRYRR